MIRCPDCQSDFKEWADFRLHVNETQHWHKPVARATPEYTLSNSAKNNAMIAVLERFYEALETGEYIEPEYGYIFTLKPAWGTVEGRERLITAIDDEFITELRTNRVTWENRGVVKHPQFFRLSQPMRVALAQQIEQVLLKG